MPLPDFVGIGAQKAGSTWLYHALSAHPGIWMTPKKEIHYFDRSPDWRDPKIEIMKRKRMGRSRLEVWLWYRRYSRLPRDTRWYASLFRPRRGQIAGEITPDYYAMDRERISQVRRLLPDAKLLFFMRNPIERTWSHAVMELRRKEKNAYDLPLEELSEFFERDYVAPRGHYTRILERWTEFYSPQSIFLGFLEDIRLNTFGLLRRVYRFLGVDEDFRPQGLRRKINSKSRESMPVEAARYLARSYHDELERLSSRFGGYASFWLYCANRLQEDAFDARESIAYPLWESPLWEEWIRQAPPGVRSQPAKVQSDLLSRS